MGAVHGVCYGMLGDDLPSRSDVVQLYKSRNIHAMRIYSPDHDALAALRDSGIFLILDVGGVDKVSDLASNPSAATDWVRTNVQAYYPNVLIRYIAVGNEVPFDQMGIILPAMQNVYNALASAGLSGSIKVSSAVRMDVLSQSFPPSAGVFRPEVQGYMTPIVQFLANTMSPLLANVYPYIAYRYNQGSIDINYALFGQANPVNDPNGLTYHNLFDAMVDAMYAALERADGRGGSVRIVVSESGWPSEGGVAATADNARRYNQGLIDHVGSGTPKKPGPLETYIFAIFNENQKPGDETERHFGLFYPNKQPVYPITFP